MPEADDLMTLLTAGFLLEASKEAIGIIVGLSSTQMSKLGRVITVIDNDEWHVLMNPVVLQRSDEHTLLVEGCASLPNIFAAVNRPDVIVVKYRDPDFNFKAIQLEDEVARIVLHEIDHLDGILITDYGMRLKKVANLDESSQEDFVVLQEQLFSEEILSSYLVPNPSDATESDPTA